MRKYLHTIWSGAIVIFGVVFLVCCLEQHTKKIYSDKIPVISLPLEEVYFSPILLGQTLSADQAIINEVSREHLSILVQSYSFTDVSIAGSLVSAKKRGVRVEVILDSSDFVVSSKVIPLLDAAGIPIYKDASHNIAHNKILIFDEETPNAMTVINGSYNFTVAAKKSNAENIKIRREDPLGYLFAKNWHFHKSEKKTSIYISK